MLASPARLVPAAFLTTVLLGAGLLMLPIARTADHGETVMPALFTSVSAVCVTGLTTVDTATFWTPFGQTVILALIQVGGFGIMSFATLLSLLVGNRLGLRSRIVAQAESHTLNLGDVTRVLRRVAIIMATFEAAIAVILTVRFHLAYHDEWNVAAWHGTFHAVSSFNNAGFSLNTDSLIDYASDAWIIVPICVAVLGGGLGFPVIAELLHRGGRPRSWTVHTRLTVYGSLALLVIGCVAFAALEWTNDDTLGPLSFGGKLNAALAGGVMPRTVGFNVIDYGVASPETLFVTDILMFIGGGSAGTAGGIKVTTFFLLAFVIWNEIRGEDHVAIAHRSVSPSTQRQALAVALLGVAAVVVGTMTLMLITGYGLQPTLFESISAFATVGLSTGITYNLPPAAELVLMTLMFLGRVGTVTIAAALALRRRPRRYRLPEERPIIG